MIVINIFIKLFLFTFFLSSHQLLANDYKKTIFADTSVRDIKIEIEMIVKLMDNCPGGLSPEDHRS